MDPEGGHIHNVVIPNSILTAPPESGFTGSTTTNGEHFHSISLTPEELTNIQAATSTSGTTGPAISHTHIYVFIENSLHGFMHESVLCEPREHFFSAALERNGARQPGHRAFVQLVVVVPQQDVDPQGVGIEGEPQFLVIEDSQCKQAFRSTGQVVVRSPEFRSDMARCGEALLAKTVSPLRASRLKRLLVWPGSSAG